MTKPPRYLIRMLLFLLAVVGVVYLLWVGLEHAFMANPVLNGLVLGVLGVGIVFNFRQVLRLNAEVAWIESFRLGNFPEKSTHLLAPMASMLREKRGKLILSPQAVRSLLDSIGMRLEESRELSRYFIGLMIFLGLLGTFWGLLETVGSIGEVIRNLNISGDHVEDLLGNLKKGLEQPLSGMGTAFGTSLIGLAGSLVLGFLDLQAAQAQNNFFNDLEEWLAGLTRISSGSGVGDGDQPIPAYIQALLEQTADSMEGLQRLMERGEENKSAANNAVKLLSDKLSALSDQMKIEQSLLLKLAEGQLEMRPILAKLAENSSDSFDEVSRKHLRNIDTYLGKISEEMPEARDQILKEIRGEIRLLARTISASQGGEERR